MAGSPNGIGREHIGTGALYLVVILSADLLILLMHMRGTI